MRCFPVSRHGEQHLFCTDEPQNSGWTHSSFQQTAGIRNLTRIIKSWTIFLYPYLSSWLSPYFHMFKGESISLYSSLPSPTANQCPQNMKFYFVDSWIYAMLSLGAAPDFALGLSSPSWIKAVTCLYQTQSTSITGRLSFCKANVTVTHTSLT